MPAVPAALDELGEGGLAGLVGTQRCDECLAVERHDVEHAGGQRFALDGDGSCVGEVEHGVRRHGHPAAGDSGPAQGLGLTARATDAHRALTTGIPGDEIAAARALLRRLIDQVHRHEADGQTPPG